MALSSQQPAWKNIPFVGCPTSQQTLRAAGDLREVQQGDTSPTSSTVGECHPSPNPPRPLPEQRHSLGARSPGKPCWPTPGAPQALSRRLQGWHPGAGITRRGPGLQQKRCGAFVADVPRAEGPRCRRTPLAPGWYRLCPAGSGASRAATPSRPSAHGRVIYLRAGVCSPGDTLPAPAALGVFSRHCRRAESCDKLVIFTRWSHLASPMTSASSRTGSLWPLHLPWDCLWCTGLVLVPWVL